MILQQKRDFKIKLILGQKVFMFRKTTSYDKFLRQILDFTLKKSKRASNDIKSLVILI